MAKGRNMELTPENKSMELIKHIVTEHGRREVKEASKSKNTLELSMFKAFLDVSNSLNNQGVFDRVDGEE